jgi:hypothetical protein
MVEKVATGTRFSVFVRFRKSRLPLRRGIGSLEEAVAAAEALRRERLHGKDDIFIVREPEGTVIELPALSVAMGPQAAPNPAPAEPALSVTMGPQAAPNPAPAEPSPRVAESPAPPSSLPPASPGSFPPGPPTSPSPVASTTRASTLLPPEDASHLARVAEARRVVARATEAGARFDRSVAALDAVLQRGGAPAALVEHQARTVALRALWARALASFEQAAVLVAARAGAPAEASAPYAASRV